MHQCPLLCHALPQITHRPSKASRSVRSKARPQTRTWAPRTPRAGARRRRPGFGDETNRAIFIWLTQRTHGETMRNIKKYGKANLVLCLHCYHFSLRKSLLKAPGSANTRSAHFELNLKPSECIRMGFKPSLASLQDGDSDCYIVWTLIHHS